MTNNDTIILKNLKFYAYHGNLQEEKVLGQEFQIDVKIHTDLKSAGISDNVEDTINYAQVYDIIKSITEEKQFNLIEALAESIAQEILKTFQTVEKITIKVRKPQAPVNGIFDYFGIEITRCRNDIQ